MSVMVMMMSVMVMVMSVIAMLMSQSLYCAEVLWKLKMGV